MFRKSFAFTMAEVLMVIAVIGVTASLALPNLSNNMEEKKTVSALRKIYAELDTAYQAVVAQYGRPPEWADITNSTSDEAMTAEFFGKFNRVLSNTSTSQSRVTRLKDNSEVEYNVKSMSDIISGLSTKTQNNSCTGEMGNLIVDVNGHKKGENTIGRDKFTFYMCYEEGLVPSGDSASGPIATNTNNDNAAWVIKAGNMDYLKCASQLNWNTKRTCK